MNGSSAEKKFGAMCGSVSGFHSATSMPARTARARFRMTAGVH